MPGASRDLTVNLIGKTDKLRAAFSGLFTGKGVKSLLGKAGIVGGAAGVGALGVGAFKLGESFDEAFDKIRVGTGATGKDFEGLQKSFKNILKDGPHSFDEVATAVADLNTRTGLSGKPLEELADQFLDVSRITGTDLGGNISSLTRLFGDWDIAAGDMAGTMDMVFRASQASGAGIDVLGRNMVQFGAPLRQMGFGFEESLALFAKFEREGVNMEAVMQGMRTGLGNMAKAGEKAPETFRRITDEIKNMEDPTAATGLAIELFGQRAGPDLAAAIREGRFDTEDFLEVIEGGSDTIEQATKDTDSWRESWEELKNKAFVALEPVATKFFDLLTRGLDGVLRFFDFIEEHGWGGALKILLEDLGSRFRQFPGIVGGALADLGELLLEKGRGALESLWTGAQNFWNDTAKPWFKDLPGNIKDALGDASLWLRFKGAAAMSGLFSAAGKFWRDTLKPWLVGLPGRVVDALGSVASTLKTKGRALLVGLMLGAAEFWFETLRPWIVDLPGRIVDFFAGAGSWLVDAGSRLIGGLIDGISGMVPALFAQLLRVQDLLSQSSVPGRAPGPSQMFGLENLAEEARRRSGGTARGGPRVMHHGGIVPGRPGQEVLTLLEAGETVMPRGSGTTMNVTVNMPPGSDGEDVVRALRQFQRQNGPIPISVR